MKCNKEAVALSALVLRTKFVVLRKTFSHTLIFTSLAPLIPFVSMFSGGK